MPSRVTNLPGSIVIAPGSTLAGTWSRKARDHPHLPAGIADVANDLRAMNAHGGVPATIEAARSAGKDPSLLVYGRTYVLRLFPSPKRNGYVIASIDPLRLADHHRLARGCLQLRSTTWETALEPRRIPAGGSAYWKRILGEWADREHGTAGQREMPGLTVRQGAFLDTLDQLIDADEKITTESSTSARPFPYRDVKPTGERRHGTHPVYEFRLAGQAPELGAFVQVRGEPGQRGQVTRTADRSATIRFDQPVDWDRIPRQGQLEETASTVVYRKQREAIGLLRSRQARNPSLLPVMVDYQVARIHPAADEPTEDLDNDQLDAFRKAVNVEDMLLVLGPPGTGKTRTISQIARACAFGVDGKREPGRVLITSHTHRAVDNVLARLPRDLLAIRVGNDGKVTADGQPYLLERQAADLRGTIINETSRALAAYGDIGIAQQWASELADRADTLSAVSAEDAQALAALQGARRAAGGAAQIRMDALSTEYSHRERALARSVGRAERLTGRAARTRERAGWPLIGPVFGKLARLWERRLARRQEDAGRLHAAQERTRGELAVAERELDAVTRDQPAVRAARAAADETARRRDECRAAALTAAHACRDVISRVDTPPPILGNENLEITERELSGFQSWLTQRLPALVARAKLLTDWHAEASGATEQLYPELIRYADVVAATCIGAASRPELSDIDFDLAIVDEAGQIGAANVLVPLVRARRGVLVGDQQQLPPYLDAAVAAWGKGVGDPAVRDLLAKSALERLVGKLPEASVVMLTWQRRMPSAIADFISAAFYDGKLRTAVSRQHRDLLFSSPMAFVDTARLPAAQRHEKSGRDREQWGQPGYTNPAEADLLTELAAFYQRQGAEWAVIVPYRAQAAAITAALTPLVGDAELVRLNVGTVDSFQGGERDVILYGFTRSNPGRNVGFLDELRRANVAFTRARHQLVLVGDMDTLAMARDERFGELARSLRDYLAEHGDVRQYRDIHDRLAASGTPAGDR